MSSLDWPSVLNRYARRVNPLMGSLITDMQYHWVTAQCEYSTDVMFNSASSLKELYPRLISHSSLCFGAKEVMSFLGKKLVGQFRGELLSDTTDRCKRRLPGVRIKHRVKMNWIKIYDKAGSVLRVEMVINDPEAFKVRKQVRRDEKQVTQWVPMRKGVANLFRYRDVSMAANHRYLDALAVVDDPTPAIHDLDKITERKRTALPTASRCVHSIRWHARSVKCSRPSRRVSTIFAGSPTEIFDTSCPNSTPSAPGRTPLSNYRPRSLGYFTVSTSMASLPRFPAREGGDYPTKGCAY
jgi:hypothetical protein